MNILLELVEFTEKLLKENEEFKDQLQDLFSKADENGKLQPYVKEETIQARPAVEDEEIEISWEGLPKKKIHAKKNDFIIRGSEDINAVKVMSKRDLEKEYELESTESKPDAEGFVPYRPKGQILAFEYEEHEPLKLKDDQGRPVNIKYGDYLGYAIDDETTLIHLDKSHFEQNYRLAE